MNRIIWAFEAIQRPTEWPAQWRKAFIIGLPVTLPAWLALMLIAVAALAVFAVVLWPLVVIGEIWEGKNP